MSFNKTILLAILMTFAWFSSLAQQNHSLFLWHDVQQSNLLNPAVPISCKWYIGLPVISSIHLNVANNSFSYNQLFTKDNTGVYNANLGDLDKLLHRRNFIGSEIHTQLFALGYKYGEYSFLFSVNEKNNLPLTYPKELMMFLLNGNEPFIGDQFSTQGTGVYFNHYREFAFGVSKDYGNGMHIGVKAKVLFGKLNISTRKTDVSVKTDETTYNLDFEGNVLVHSSLPIIVEVADNQITNIEYDGSVSPIDLAFNRKNPGIAIDAGVIYPFNDKIKLSASLLDIGFIRWRSNLNTFDAHGEFTYQGALSDNIPMDNYLQNLRIAFLDNMNFQVYEKKYATFLPPKAILGANYQYNHWLSAGAVADVIYHKSKLLPALTLTAQANPIRSIGFMASYSVQKYSYNNVGFGFFIGKNPVQFYIISDNVLALLKPLNARMTNVRFGLNINLGCSEKNEPQASGYSSQGCFGMNKHDKPYMKNLKPWNKRK